MNYLEALTILTSHIDFENNILYYPNDTFKLMRLTSALEILKNVNNLDRFERDYESIRTGKKIEHNNTTSH